MLFLEYPPCSTCQKAKKWLDGKNMTYEDRNIKTANPSYEELKVWQERSGQPLKKFFNTSGMVYKSMNLKEKLPEMTQEQQLQLLASDGMLVKRPLLILDDTVLIGFKESQWEQVLCTE